MQSFSDVTRKQSGVIALVPTMGFLHEGHLSLIRRGRQLADVVVTSIYVNPTQFGLQEDFHKYPRNLKRDAELAQGAGNDVLFVPLDQEMYPERSQTIVRVEELTRPLCGAMRPGHFQGVTTVVAKLFNIVKPHTAIFGQKDAQQALVIRRMVRDLHFDVHIHVEPIIREPDGLAMSSRNQYLSPKGRKDAAVLYQSLQKARHAIESGETDSVKIITIMRAMITAVPSRIDYIEIVDAESLQPLSVVQGNVLIALAVYIDQTRLVDNLLLSC